MRTCSMLIFRGVSFITSYKFPWKLHLKLRWSLGCDDDPWHRLARVFWTESRPKKPLVLRNVLCHLLETIMLQWLQVRRCSGKVGWKDELMSWRVDWKRREGFKHKQCSNSNLGCGSRITIRGGNSFFWFLEFSPRNFGKSSILTEHLGSSWSTST